MDALARTVPLLCALSLAACGGSKDPPLGAPGPSGGDASIDARSDGSIDGSADAPPTDSSRADTAHPPIDAPPPGLDAAIDDFGTKPPAGSHAEAAIGPDGGSVVGASGTALAGVTLVVPPGALKSKTLVALDLDAFPPPPDGATPVTPFVRVGPDGLAFTTPARLTLPYTSTADRPQFVSLERVGVTWSALLEPSVDPALKSITASMSRASGAAGFVVVLAAAPAPTTFSPPSASAGSIVFLEGGSFGIAPAWQAGVDAGAPSSASVIVGGVVAQVLAWGDGELAFRMPAGASGVITVTTPAGSGSTAAAIGP